jgi:Uma2 family endonuclease
MREWPRRHRISVDHFYRMADAGLFAENGRVELIDGEIVDMPPMGSRHAGTLSQLAGLLTECCGADALIRQQLPLRLGDHSEPLPDIAVVRRRADYYKRSHPTAADTLLVVELGDSTLRYDREVKAALYARHEVPEYWVVDLKSRCLHRYREPQAGRFSHVTTVDFGRVVLATLDDCELDLAPLA